MKGPKIGSAAIVTETQFAIEDEVRPERGEGLYQARQPITPFSAVL
jgi:hypothetical protein